MSKLLNELKELTADAVADNKLQQAAALVEKWDKTGLLEGYDAQKKYIASVMLQSQSLAVRKTLNESTETTDIAGFNKIAFPLVRKMLDKLLAYDIVSVQPMDKPSGLLFYLDYQFGSDTQEGFTQNSSLFQDKDTSVSGKLGGIGAGLAEGGFYDLKSHYSNRFISTTGVAVAAVDADTVRINWAALTGIGAGADESRPIFIETTGGSTYAELEFSSWSGASADFNIVGSSTTAAVLTGATDVTTFKYVPATDLTHRGDFESVSAIPSVNLKVESIPVTAGTRKMKTEWTPESAQDLQAYHGIDVEVEVTSAISDAASLELNNEILNDLILASKNGGTLDHWSYKIGNYVDSSGSAITGMSYSTGHIAFHGTQREWNETLVNKMSKVGNQIYKKTLRGEANWSVVSPEVATIFDTTLAWKTAEGANRTYSSGIDKVGSISNKVTIYKHATFPAAQMLMGYKGSQWLETGYVWAPYILLTMTPTIYNYNDFTPRKGLITRNAKQVIRPEFYGSIVIDDLNNL